MTEEHHLWGALFKANTEEEFKMLMDESEEIKVAGEKLLALSKEDDAREIARARAEAEKLEIIRKLLDLKTPLDIISKASNMPESEILKLTQQSE